MPMTCPCGNAVPDVTTHLGFCSTDCLDAEVFYQQIREPLAQLLEDGAA